VANGVWRAGDPAPVNARCAEPLTSVDRAVAPVAACATLQTGGYDVSRVGPGCAGSIVAAADAGPAAGFDVTADPIPLLSRHGVLFLVIILGAISLWLAMAGSR
jgi:hypothetical protein